MTHYGVFKIDGTISCDWNTGWVSNDVASLCWGGGGTGVGSVRETKEFIVHPDTIKRLGQGRGIFVNKQDFRVQPVAFRRGKI